MFFLQTKKLEDAATIKAKNMVMARDMMDYRRNASEKDITLARGYVVMD